ncbi:MAG: PTS sugar transporter subunit IIA [Candidatus Fermentibacteraceae bacterium]|nr:PTS sugar transporter subunit IIA [Candidatus Fermentibacteraceae bacterium]MBN2609904.1 PTS sugar transporter subunit IIA [Candidatus Fermentibacteraceae bacterium]
MNLMDVLDPELIVFSPDLTDKEDVLRKISSMAAVKDLVGNATEDEVYDAFLTRESLGSTGFGHGVAIPHCRIAGAGGFLAGMIITPKGIDFDSIDGESVRIFPFVVGPESEAKEYLRILSSIAQLLRSETVRKQILSLASTEEVHRFLKEQTRVEDTAPSRRPGMKMMHVFVQNEDLFDDILQIFTGSDSVSAVVLETHESTDYLMKGPFFAGFWDTSVQRFNRLIVAVIRDELVNGVVRSIEYACGKLADRDDVLVTVTDLHYTLGSLSI